MRSAWGAFEMRAAARVRSRRRPLLAVAVTALITASLLALARGAEAREAVVTTVTFMGFLLPVVYAHGMVSADLRSGVALLWLQKPGSPVGFYLRRWVDVTAAALLISLAACGAAALLMAFCLELETGRTVLALTPTILLWGVCICAVVFGFSAWGTSLDTVLALLLVYFSGFVLVAEGRSWSLLRWAVMPLEAIATLGRFLGGGGFREVAPHHGLRVGVFVLLWISLGVMGVSLSTRCPIPRDSSR